MRKHVSLYALQQRPMVPSCPLPGSQVSQDGQAVECCSRGCQCLVQEWLDVRKLSMVFLCMVWGRLSFRRRLLCWDAFRCHRTAAVKQKLSKLRTDMAMIPAGCTGIIQAPDVSWNKPFKAHYRELYEAWLRSDAVEFTKGI